MEQVVSTGRAKLRKVVRMQKAKVALNVVMFAASVVASLCGVIMKGIDVASEIRSE